ncbi:nucleotidyltransferase domain-containing protein [Ruminococcaceae bacterium OttesenSCG-928-L11]|nr:nucleotidyltransferase domain-containing protein [Ruminococcaceae bacterium OttesenSCG-928-L11]
MDAVTSILNRAAASLSAVPGVVGIALGGSRARGTDTPDSDIDIGVYYDNATLDIAALNAAAQTVDDEHRAALIAPPGEWGKWVNGGGWLTVDGYHVDFILRDIGRVKEEIEKCLGGTVSTHYQTGHPHGYINAMYMGELAVCRLLWERDGAVSPLKRTAEAYPDRLREALVGFFSFEAGFSLMFAETSGERDDVYYTTAHIVRSVSALNQVLFARNREYCLNEKKAVGMIDGFAIKPANYKGRIDAVFAAAGVDNRKACALLRQLVDEVNALSAGE